MAGNKRCKILLISIEESLGTILQKKKGEIKNTFFP
tara:strand:- start:5653 stop:5760 length:108 start_codon:yes stop_codon:yes gene_type:complete